MWRGFECRPCSSERNGGLVDEYTYYETTNHVDVGAFGRGGNELESLLDVLDGCWANQRYGVKADDVAGPLTELLNAGFSADQIREELRADSRLQQNEDPRYRPRPGRQILRLRNCLLADLALGEKEPVGTVGASNESIQTRILMGGPWPQGSCCQQLEGLLLDNNPEVKPYLTKHFEELIREIDA